MSVEVKDKGDQKPPNKGGQKQRQSQRASLLAEICSRVHGALGGPNVGKATSLGCFLGKHLFLCNPFMMPDTKPGHAVADLLGLRPSKAPVAAVASGCR